MGARLGAREVLLKKVCGGSEGWKPRVDLLPPWRTGFGHRCSFGVRMHRLYLRVDSKLSRLGPVVRTSELRDIRSRTDVSRRAQVDCSGPSLTCLPIGIPRWSIHQIAEPGTGSIKGGQVTAAQHRLIVRHRLVPLHRTRLMEYSTCSSFADLARHACLAHHGSPTIRRQYADWVFPARRPATSPCSATGPPPATSTSDSPLQAA